MKSNASSRMEKPTRKIRVEPELPAQEKAWVLDGPPQPGSYTYDDPEPYKKRQNDVKS